MGQLTPKIKRNVVLSNHSQGGLGIVDIYSYSKSIKFMWIKTMIDNSLSSSWKDLLTLNHDCSNCSK